MRRSCWLPALALLILLPACGRGSIPGLDPGGPRPGGGTTTAPPPPAATPAPAALVSWAVWHAKEALYWQTLLDAELAQAKTAGEKAEIQQRMEAYAKDALREIFASVQGATRTSPAKLILVYQVAQDALGSGNGSGDPAKRTAYYLAALGRISVLED